MSPKQPPQPAEEGAVALQGSVVRSQPGEVQQASPDLSGYRFVGFPGTKSP